MDKTTLVLIDLLIKDQLAKIDIPEGPQGPRGLRGKDGNDFNIEDHSEALIDFIQEHSNIVLTSEQIESLQGRDGKDGTSVTLEEVLPHLTDSLQSKISEMRDELKLKFSDLSEDDLEAIRGPKGRDGKDGESFVFEEHEQEIENRILNKVQEMKESLKLKFSDLTDEERLSIKGSRGQKGKAGKDFVFEENAEQIQLLINKYIDEKIPELKLNFSDLDENDIEAIRGPKGRDGKDGENFVFEEHSVEIQNQICEYIDSVKDYFKLNFSDLSEEEKESLKLKFSDLSEEDRLSLKGSRGQRGKAGVDGQDGKDGATWTTGQGVPTGESKEGNLYLDLSDCSVYKYKNNLWEKSGNIRGARGIPGQSGLNGKDGKNGIDGLNGYNGRDGKDAPYIVDVTLDTRKNKEFKIIFEMSDGTTHETNYVDFPATVQNFYYSTGVVSSGGGGGTGTANPTEYFDEGVSVGTSEKVNFIGPNVSAVKVGDTVNVTFTDADTDTNTTDLHVQDEGIEKVVTNTIDFVGAGVDVTTSGGKAVVTINGGGSANLEIQDEGTTLTTSVQKINFIGPYITARQKVTINEWNPLSNVEPNMLDYQGNGVSDEIEVYVDIPDSSILRDISCEPSVYVGAFVLIDSSEVARNALADSYNNSNVIGLVESKESTTKCTVRVSGISSAIFTGLNPSYDYFLSDTVPGGMDSIVPTTSGHIKLKLGQAFGTNKFLIQKGERVVRL